MLLLLQGLLKLHHFVPSVPAFEDIILENLLEISSNQNNFRIVICESRIELSSN